MEFFVYECGDEPCHDRELPSLNAESFKAAKEHAKEHANESGRRTYVMDEVENSIQFIASPGNRVTDFSEGKWDEADPPNPERARHDNEDEWWEGD